MRYPGGFVLRVQDGPAPNGIVRKDYGTGAGEPDRLLQVLRIAALIRVYEREVERLVGHRGQKRLRVPDPHLDPLREASLGYALAGHLCAATVELQRDQAPVCGQRPGEVDRAVLAERPDLQDAPRPRDPREDLRELPLARGDPYLRRPGLARAPEGVFSSAGSDGAKRPWT